MKKYPFSPAVLAALPEELAELFRGLEDKLLREICSRLMIGDELNEVTVADIKALRSHGIDLKDIKKAIKEVTGISDKKLEELITDVVERNQQYYTELIDFAKVTQPEVMVDARDIEAIKAQTKMELHNITQSLGFLVDSGRTMLPPAKAYQWALDSAVLQVESGGISYREAVKSAVRTLAEGGVKVAQYESGHVDQIDVAVRRAVMTGVNQLCSKYTEQSAEWLDTPYFEVSAHIGARDKEGASPWSSHKAWQGKVYSVKANDIYPSIYEVCGLGYVDGLEGANCRHKRSAWVEGVSERTYTDEQLAHIDDGHDCTYDGRHYTAYEATQMQRRIERSMRKQKRLRDAYKAAGLTEDAQAANVKLRRLSGKYKEFSKAANLPEQRERTKVVYIDDASTAAAERLKAQRAAAVDLKRKENAAILKSRIESGEISTKIRPQVQLRHIEGTAQFDEYKARRISKGKTPQSILTVTAEEAQGLADRYTCTGTVEVQRRSDGTVKIIEYCDADKVIGRYYEDDAYRDAKRFGIYYSKKGTHIVPTPPEGVK